MEIRPTIEVQLNPYVSAAKQAFALAWTKPWSLFVPSGVLVLGSLLDTFVSHVHPALTLLSTLLRAASWALYGRVVVMLFALDRPELQQRRRALWIPTLVALLVVLSMTMFGWLGVFALLAICLVPVLEALLLTTRRPDLATQDAVEFAFDHPLGWMAANLGALVVLVMIWLAASGLPAVFFSFLNDPKLVWLEDVIAALCLGPVTHLYVVTRGVFFLDATEEDDDDDGAYE